MPVRASCTYMYTPKPFWTDMFKLCSLQQLSHFQAKLTEYTQPSETSPWFFRWCHRDVAPRAGGLFAPLSGLSLMLPSRWLCPWERGGGKRADVELLRASAVKHPILMYMWAGEDKESLNVTFFCLEPSGTELLKRARVNFSGIPNFSGCRRVLSHICGDEWKRSAWRLGTGKWVSAVSVATSVFSEALLSFAITFF